MKKYLMKSLTDHDCDACEDSGYIIVKDLKEDIKRKCPCCDRNMEKK